MEEEVVKNIRACVIASKGGLTFDDLRRDYKVLLDEKIPFKKLGYPTLADFLNIVPGIKIYGRRGEYFIEAIPTSKSAHISKLVSQQETAKKLKRLDPASTEKVPSVTKEVLSTTKKISSHTEKVLCLPKKDPCLVKNVIDTSRMVGSKYTATTTNPRPIKITFYLNNEKPRYIHPIPPTPPSKRLKERQISTNVCQEQSSSKSKDDCYNRNNKKIYHKPKTVNNNVDTYYRSYYHRDHSPRLSKRSMKAVRKRSHRDRSPRTSISDRYHHY